MGTLPPLARQHQLQFPARRNKQCIRNNTPSLLLHFQSNNQVADPHHRCNLQLIMDTVLHHPQIKALAPLHQAAMVPDRVAGKADLLSSQCQDRPLLQLLQLAQTQHCGLYLKLLTKMVTQTSMKMYWG